MTDDKIMQIADEVMFRITDSINHISSEISRNSCAIEAVAKELEKQTVTIDDRIYKDVDVTPEPYECYKNIYKWYTQYSDVLTQEEIEQLQTLFRLNSGDYRRTVIAFEVEKERKYAEIEKEN